MNPDRYLRTFHLLDLLVGRKDGLRPTEIKDALGLPASSVHNMLQTMVSAEVANVSEDLRYTVGPRAVLMALRTLQSLDIRTVARRYLQDLVKEIGDDVYLAMRVGKRVFYADRLLGNQRISLATSATRGSAVGRAPNRTTEHRKAKDLARLTKANLPTVGSTRLASRGSAPRNPDGGCGSRAPPS